MKKRLLSLVLAVGMVLATIPVTGHAADGDFDIRDGVLTDYTGPGGDVVIPDGVTRIGVGAFKKCVSLTSVTIPDGVTSIGATAFSGCTNLSGVTIPGSVTTIGENAFTSCNSLAYVTLPEGVTTLEIFAFADCYNLIRIAIPKSVTSMDRLAFSGSYQYPNVYYGGSKADWEALGQSVGALSKALIHYNSSMPSTTFPSILNSTAPSKSVSWSGRQMIERLPIPPKEVFAPSNEEEAAYWQYRAAGEPWESPKSIDETLAEIKALSQDLTQGKSSETAKARAIFDWVTSNITYGGPGKSPLSNAADALSTFYFRQGQCDGYTKLSNLMLAYIGLPAARISGTAQKGGLHGWSAVYADGRWLLFDATWGKWDISPDFHNHTNMIDMPYGSILIKVHNGNEYIYGRESDCVHVMAEKLPGFQYTDLVLPDGVTGVEEQGFEYCRDITTLTCPEGMAVLRRYAFFICSNLTRVVLPSSLEFVEDGVFAECNNLREIQVAPDNPAFVSVDGVLFTRSGTLVACPAAKEGVYVVPKGTTAIASEAFRGCEKLTDIVLPDGLISIGGAAFWGFDGNLTIPDSVDYIKVDALSQARGHVYFKGSRELWETIAPGVTDGNPLTKMHFNSVGPAGATAYGTGYTAKATNDKLTVDGVTKAPTAYKINNANYFQLRDVAVLLNSTKAQFSVDYDDTAKAIKITTGQPYQPNGKEMKGAKATAEAIVGNNDVYINGVKTDFVVYKIGGSNFFQIRDLGKVLGFNVDWAKDVGIIIDPSKPYSGK